MQQQIATKTKKIQLVHTHAMQNPNSDKISNIMIVVIHQKKKKAKKNKKRWHKIFSVQLLKSSSHKLVSVMDTCLTLCVSHCSQCRFKKKKKKKRRDKTERETY